MNSTRRRFRIMTSLLFCSCAISLSACAGPPGPPGPAGPAGSGNVTAFRHTRTAANECSPGAGLATYSALDHAALNGNPNALLFVTALIGINAGRTNTNPNSNLLVVYTGSQTFGTCPAGRWIVSGGDVATGAQYDVMVANP